MANHRIRRKLFIQAAIACTCLFEAVGCPQILSQSVIQGTRTFLESGLPAAILAAFDFDDLLGTDSGGS